MERPAVHPDQLLSLHSPSIVSPSFFAPAAAGSPSAGGASCCCWAAYIASPIFVEACRSSSRPDRILATSSPLIASRTAAIFASTSVLISAEALSPASRSAFSDW